MEHCHIKTEVSEKGKKQFKFICTFCKKEVTKTELDKIQKHINKHHNIQRNKPQSFYPESELLIPEHEIEENRVSISDDESEENNQIQQETTRLEKARNAAITQILTSINPPLSQFVSPGPFSYNYWHFLFHHGDNEVSCKKMDEILRHIQEVYAPGAEIPNSYYEMTEAINSLFKIAPRTVGKSSIYSIRDVLNVVANDPARYPHLHFDYVPPINGTVTEFYETKGFKEEIEKLEQDAIGFLLFLYYDDYNYNNFRLKSSGAIYCIVMNMDRSISQHPENIFIIALIHEEDDFFEIIKHVMEEIRVLRLPFKMKVNKIDTKSQVFFTLWGTDMVARLESLYMNSIRGYYPCTRCFIHKRELLLEPSTYSSGGFEITRKRTIQKMKKGMELVKTSNVSLKWKHDLCGQFNLKYDNVIRGENPLFNYDMDIFQRSVLDLFHNEIIGLFRAHTNLLILKLSGSQQRELLTKCDKTVIKDLKRIPHWDAERMMFMASNGPFLLRDIALKDTAFYIYYSIYLKHIQYLNLMLSNSIDNNLQSKIRDLYYRFRREFCTLYPSSLVENRPNIHVGTHLIDEDMTNWGPLPLTWLKFFECKHKTTKRDLGNNRDIEIFSSKQDWKRKLLNFVFPYERRLFLHAHFPNDEIRANYNTFYFKEDILSQADECITLSKVSFRSQIFQANNIYIYDEDKICRIIDIKLKNNVLVSIREFKYSDKDRITQAPMVRGEWQEIELIPCERIKKRIAIFDNFFNIYSI